MPYKWFSFLNYETIYVCEHTVKNPTLASHYVLEDSKDKLRCSRQEVKENLIWKFGFGN